MDLVNRLTSEIKNYMTQYGLTAQGAFEKFDIDHDGELSVDEFRDYFSDTYFVPTDYKLYDWTLKL